MRPAASFALLIAGVVALSCSADAPPEDSAATSEPVTVCAGPTTVPGIDVSSYQGTINWTQVKAAGKQFAYARLSDGTGAVDATFAANWAGMQTAGVLRGAYQYFEPAQDPGAQAALVVQKVGKLGVGDLPVMLDVEVTGSEPAATIIANMKTWIAAVEVGTGRAPVLYTNPGFWTGSVNSSDFASLDLFIANYGVTCPNVPSPWTNWVFWQDSGTATVTGITNQVDTDQFNGTLAQLQALATPAPPDAGTDGSAGDAAVAESGAGDAGVVPESGPPDASSPPDASVADGAPTSSLEARPGPGLWCATSTAAPDSPLGTAGLPLVALGLLLSRRRAGRSPR